MKVFVEAAGGFIYPLGLCSFVAVFLIVERLLALRPGKVIPAALAAYLAAPGNVRPPVFAKSAGGRIVAYFLRTRAGGEQLKAYAQFELSRLERGVFLLDTIVGIAPLLGLLGTVYGLFVLFPEKGLPKAEDMSHGVGLALTTTILGLFIAIPALLCANWIARRLELISARVNLLVERILALDDALENAEVNATAAATTAGGSTGNAAANNAAAAASTREPPPLPPTALDSGAKGNAGTAAAASAAREASPSSQSAAAAPARPSPILAPDGSVPPPRPAPRKLEFELKPLTPPPSPANAASRPARKP